MGGGVTDPVPFTWPGKEFSLLEFIILFVMCRSIGTKVRAKGRTAIGYQFLLLALWFGGELAGAILGVITSLATGAEEPSLVLAYFLALIGAFLGAKIAFVIVNSLSDLRKPLYDARDVAENLRNYFDGRSEEQDQENSPSPLAPARPARRDLP
jgi:hypothetical protein